ncbi:MAG: TorF family putative porin [Ghiorsea sp.]|nr:TorF family putative porin [Ghiorsea sp.]MDQ7004531.1 TorF family putative porin [Ghiorsea sp.]
MMIKQIKYILGVSLMLGAITIGNISAQAADIESLMSDVETTDSNIGLYSQYIFRGQRQSAGSLSVQGDVGWEHDSGVSANVWFATLGAGNNATEFDVTLDYSADLGFIGYSAGMILYRYHNNGASNATEVYAGVTHELGAAELYYDINSQNIWLDLSSGIELAELSIDGTLSFSAPNVGTSELVNLAIGVSKEVEMRDIVLSPSLTYNYHMGALNTVATPDALVFAINFAY